MHAGAPTPKKQQNPACRETIVNHQKQGSTYSGKSTAIAFLQAKQGQRYTDAPKRAVKPVKDRLRTSLDGGHDIQSRLYSAHPSLFRRKTG